MPSLLKWGQILNFTLLRESGLPPAYLQNKNLSQIAVAKQHANQYAPLTQPTAFTIQKPQKVPRVTFSSYSLSLIYVVCLVTLGHIGV